MACWDDTLKSRWLTETLPIAFATATVWFSNKDPDPQGCCENTHDIPTAKGVIQIQLKSTDLKPYEATIGKGEVLNSEAMIWEL